MKADPVTGPFNRERHMSLKFTESRIHPRFKLPAMYTLIRVRSVGEERYPWTGYIYDISMSGLRFELDDVIDPGSHIEVRAMLPGVDHITFCASGRVVRIHDDSDEQGPIRMGMAFDEFASDEDRVKLEEYLFVQNSRMAA